MSCSITGLPIKDGDEAYMFPLLGGMKYEGFYNPAHTYVTDNFNFLTIPILGRYNDYGTIDCMDEEYYKDYIKVLKLHLIPYSGEYRKTWEELFEQQEHNGSFMENFLKTMERYTNCGDGNLSVYMGKAKSVFRRSRRGINSMLVHKSFIDKLLKEWVPSTDGFGYWFDKGNWENSIWGDLSKEYMDQVKLTYMLFDYMTYANIQITPSNYASQTIHYNAIDLMNSFRTEYVDKAYEEYKYDFENCECWEDGQPSSREEFIKKGY